MPIAATIKRGIPEVLGIDITAMDPFGSFTDINGLLVPSPTYIPITAALPVIGSIAKGTAGSVAPDQTAKLFSSSGGVSINTGATVALYTVTAGKNFFITDIILTGNAATAGQVLCQIKQAATVIWEGYVKTDTSPIEFPGIETQPTAPGGAAVSLVIGTLAGGTLAYFIAGFEQ